MNFDQQLAADREAAFKLLRDIVEENHKAGRPSYGASLKPELLRRTNHGFSEPRLQYSSFGEFLSEAARADHISLYPAPKGPDRLAAPPGTEPPVADDATTRRLPRINKELWDCFIDWDPGWIRVYDRVEDRPRNVPENAAPLEPDAYAQLRSAILADSEHTRFVPIPSVSFDEHVGWMRSLAEQEADPATRARLVAATEDRRPARAFTQALLSVPEARRRWHARRHAEIEARIRRWAHEAGLEIEIYEVQQARTPTSEADEARRGPTSAADERLAKLRAVLHDAIDRMPEGELRELSLPVGYVVE